MANPIATARAAMPANLVTVSIKSQITPTIVMDAAGKQTSGKRNAFGDFLMGLVKPSISVNTPAGEITSSPWGVPSSNLIPALLIAGGILGFSVLGLAFALGKRSNSD